MLEMKVTETMVGPSPIDCSMVARVHSFELPRLPSRFPQGQGTAHRNPDDEGARERRQVAEATENPGPCAHPHICTQGQGLVNFFQ